MNLAFEAARSNPKSLLLFRHGRWGHLREFFGKECRDLDNSQIARNRLHSRKIRGAYYGDEVKILHSSDLVL